MNTADRTYNVRPAAVADLSAVVDLVEAVAAEGRWIGTEQVDRPQRHDHLLASLSNPLEGNFVADASGLVVGQIAMSLRPYGVADVGMLVAAPWRGIGVGSALLGAGVDWARQAGAHKVALGAWPHNEAALALYRKFGFAVEGLLRRHYRRRNGELWDAVLMGLLLVEEHPGGEA
ncbi:MAG: GNAT family N-acetyltransferase [Acidimicrobiales bacterium]